ncbi:MAG: hypothetical protein JWO06_89 [Bacteroidota bacterium]|nr:hypothetical protein [Bacteroidota bacterium]
MTPNEKRYFKLFSDQQPGEKRYLQLFDALESEEDFDTAGLCKLLNVKPAQLADDKYYLNQAVLKSLRNTEELPWQQPQHFKTLMNIDILLNRGTVEPALVLIEKALADARHLEIHPLIIILLNSKRRAMVSKGTLSGLNDIIEELKTATAATVEYNELLNICTECQVLDFERKDKRKISAILKHPLLQKKPEQLLSSKAASCWFNTYQQAYDLLGENDKLMDITRHMVTYYQAHRNFLDISPTGYILGHLSLAQAESIKHNHARSLELMAALKPFLNKPPQYLSPGQLENVRFYFYLVEAHVVLAIGQYQKAVSLGEELYLNKNSRVVYEQYALIYNLAVALLHTKRSKDAYDKLEELLQMGDDIRVDLQIYVRPLLILAHLDMEHFSLIPYQIKSAKSWMKRKKMSNSGLDVFFHHAYALAKTPGRQRKATWVKLKEAVENGEMKDFDDQVRSLKTWLKSKTEMQ